MGIDQICQNVIQLNASAAAAESKKKPAKKAPPAVKTNGNTHLSDEENLRITLARAIAAFGLEQQGVTVDKFIAGIKAYETKYQGVVQ